LFNIRSSSASADVVEMPALCSCLISLRIPEKATTLSGAW
jgi:hypothetical protein